MTQYLFRLFAAIPAEMVDAYNAWLAGVIDPAADRSFTVGLNATGDLADSITAYLTCAAVTASQLETLATEICGQAGIALPVDWDAMTRDAQRDWFRNQAEAVKAVTGIIVLILDDNDGEWSDYRSALEAAGLRFPSRDI